MADYSLKINNVQELKDYLGHGYQEDVYEEVFMHYKDGLIDEKVLIGLKGMLDDDK